MKMWSAERELDHMIVALVILDILCWLLKG